MPGFFLAITLSCYATVGGFYHKDAYIKRFYFQCRVGSVFRVTHQALRSNSICFFNECLAAHLVGYGAKHTPNPPYILVEEKPHADETAAMGF